MDEEIPKADARKMEGEAPAAVGAEGEGSEIEGVVVEGLATGIEEDQRADHLRCARY